MRELTARDDGTFSLRMMLPGTYSILVEVEGFQPVRVRGVVVAAGRTTTIGVELEERPPPITSVTEIVRSGTSVGPAGRVVAGREVRILEYRADAADLSRGLTELAAPMDGRAGLAEMAAGLPEGMTRVFADGVPELLLRHPGLRSEPGILAVFPRDAVGEVQVFGSALDTEWRGNPGSVFSLGTRSGGNRFEFAPFFRGSSAKLGGNSALNPADSGGTSLWAGASVSGPIKRDTAYFFLQGNYQSVETPSPYPWAQDEATFGGAPVSLRETIQSIGSTRYSTDLAGAVAPVVRTWKGGSGLGRMDWRLSRNAQFMFRASGAGFTEKSPLLGTDAASEAGASLKGRDLSAAAALTLAGKISNEARIGVALVRREWEAGTLPATRIVADGVRFGGNLLLPARFETRTVSLSDAAHYQWRDHAIKGGVSLDYTSYLQEYDYGSVGQFLFADLDRYNSGNGAFFGAASTNPEAKVAAPQVGVFLQDTWRLRPGFDLLWGLRYETQVLPRNRIRRNELWEELVGVVTDSVPQDRRGIQPRLGFVLDPGNRGSWTIQGGVGLYASGLDLASYAEAVQNSGSNVQVTRIVGNLSWPAPPPAVEPPRLSTRLTLLPTSDKYRAPRTLKADLGIAGALRGGFSLRLAGSYYHTDYLSRRSDLNRSAFPSGEIQDGRPVWGALVQEGGLVTVSPGTSRRFSEFDLVSALTSTGFSDHYELTVALTRPVGTGATIAAQYTFSRTRDNLVGLREPDPADQLSPFPEGINGADWDEGRSDLDIPHRAAVTLELRPGPVSLAARARWRSGLPFTPGFRSGVDVNGDLGGNNDPAPIEAVTNPSGPSVFASCDRTSVAGFAARNSCRESGVGSLDVQLGVPLEVGGGRRLVFAADVFNLVSTTTGVIDRAALLIDPNGSLTADPATGGVTIPYLANPRFGTLLRRGGEPRVVRVGLRMEY